MIYRCSKLFLVASVAVVTLLPAVSVATDLEAIRKKILRDLSRGALSRPIARLPETKGPPLNGVEINKTRVNGVVVVGTKGGFGGGIVVSSQGDIVTNQHVVRRAHKQDGAEWVLVWFAPSGGLRLDENKSMPAKVLRQDVSLDLAVIHLASSLPHTAAAIPLGSKMPEIGERVFTIGHPKQYFWSFMEGVVSQIRPDYHLPGTGDESHTITAIQTQTLASPGISGSALLDTNGELIGLFAAGDPLSQGINFAIAIQHVREFLGRPQP